MQTGGMVSQGIGLGDLGRLDPHQAPVGQGGDKVLRAGVTCVGYLFAHRPGRDQAIGLRHCLEKSTLV